MTVPAWLKGSILLAVVFAAGIAIGAGFERRRAPDHGPARMDSHHLMQRLRDDLALDSAQEQAISLILARRQRTIDSTWHMVQPHVHATMDSTLQEVVNVLRPEQAAKYGKLMTAMHPNGDHAPDRRH